MSKSIDFSVELIRLIDVNIKKAEIDNPEELKSVFSDGYKLIMRFKFQFATESSSRLAKTYFILNLSATNTATNKFITCQFEIVYTFFVDQLPGLLLQKENAVIIDTQLGISMANIAYSTSRGIVFTRCSGTVFDGTILPILSNSIIENIVRQEESVVNFD